MSFATTLLPSILNTVLGRLALLFVSGANDDLTAARQAAAHMLAAYNPETEDELRLAAEVVTFSFHALEALSQASTPEMPLNKILRLRSGAVSLSRESHKAQHRLDQLQKTRREGIQPQPTTAQDEPVRPPVERAIALIEATRPAIQPTRQNTAPIWSKSHQQREAARRIAQNLKTNQAAHAAMQPPVVIASEAKRSAAI
jgi:hypothetical protein